MIPITQLRKFKLVDKKIDSIHTGKLQEHFGDFFIFLWSNILDDISYGYYHKDKVYSLKDTHDYCLKIKKSLAKYIHFPLNKLTYLGIEQSIIENGNLLESASVPSNQDLYIKDVLRKNIGINGITENDINFTHRVIENYFIYKAYYPNNPMNPWSGLFKLFQSGLILKFLDEESHIHLGAISSTDSIHIKYDKKSFQNTFHIVDQMLSLLVESLNYKGLGNHTNLHLTENLENLTSFSFMSLIPNNQSKNIDYNSYTQIKYNLTKYYFLIAPKRSHKITHFLSRIHKIKYINSFSAFDFDAANNINYISSPLELSLISGYIEEYFLKNRQKFEAAFNSKKLHFFHQKIIDAKNNSKSNPNQAADALYYFLTEAKISIPSQTYSFFPIWVYIETLLLKHDISLPTNQIIDSKKHIHIYQYMHTHFNLFFNKKNKN